MRGGPLALLLLLAGCKTFIDASHPPGVDTLVNPNCLFMCKYEQPRAPLLPRGPVDEGMKG
jgi:hypothetical protein